MFYAAITIAAILLIGWVAIAVARRRSQQFAQQYGPMLPFTLHDLRKMREAGQLTDEEFERARQRIVKLSKQQLDPQTPGGQEAEAGEGGADGGAPGPGSESDPRPGRSDGSSATGSEPAGG